MAERGYPINYKTGNVIHGLTSSFGHNIKIFHAGTKRDNNNKKILTSGGRVLGVTSIGRDFGKARSSAYDAVKKIYCGKANQYYRKDIGLKVI